jgi:hypothetical protein
MKRGIRAFGFAPSLTALATAAGLAALAAAPAPASAQASARPAQAETLIQHSAEALGGAARLRALKNVTLYGYGQVAWVSGGEEISASPHVPIKYEALNDLRRVYDVEHDRFQMRERGYMLFPFLAANSYNYILVDRRLDGDIPYDTTTGGMFGSGQGPMTPHRVANLTNDFQGGDGVHARRMWMMNNPAVLVRALMDPTTQVSLPRIDGKYVDVDVTLKQGDHLTVGFFTANRFCQAFCKDLPAFVRWGAPHPDLGQANYTTWFTGYEDINGLMLPFGYDTRLDWRDTDWQRLYVDHYDIDGQIPDLAAPPDVRNAPAPPNARLAPVVAQKVADHIWRLAPTGTTAIEFADHITLFELDASPEQAKATIAFARTLVPGKPVTQLIASHEHFDHVSGLREAVSEGLTVIGRRASGEYFEEMVEHPAPEFPDDLARNPKPLHFIPLVE